MTIDDEVKSNESTHHLEVLDQCGERLVGGCEVTASGVSSAQLLPSTPVAG